MAPPASLPFGVYLERRVLLFLLLGFSAGLPLALSGSTLTIWMADKGVNLGAIGLYALVGLPYTIKFLWAPVVDAFRIPVLHDWLGRRCGWLVFSQLVLMGAIILLSGLDPLRMPITIAAAALLVAAASATQDIVIDAFRVESLPDDRQAAGMACYVTAYRVAMLVSSAGVIALVAMLEGWGVAPDLVWQIGYAAAAGLILIGTAAAIIAREPDDDGDIPARGQGGNPIMRFWNTAHNAFGDFFTKDSAFLILLFVILFKLGDTFAGIMTGPFVLAIGFDKAAYAGIVKGVGLAASLIGAAAGGLVARRFTFAASLWIAGILQLLSNLIFCWQAWIGPVHSALATTIFVENFTGAIGTVIFVAYLSSLCSARAHTATQFALLTALAAVGRTILSSGSGFVAAETGWVLFFAVTAVAALPGLMVLLWLQQRGLFRTLDRPAQETAAAI